MDRYTKFFDIMNLITENNGFYLTFLIQEYDTLEELKARKTTTNTDNPTHYYKIIYMKMECSSASDDVYSHSDLSGNVNSNIELKFHDERVNCSVVEC